MFGIGSSKEAPTTSNNQSDEKPLVQPQVEQGLMLEQDFRNHKEAIDILNLLDKLADDVIITNEEYDKLNKHIFNVPSRLKDAKLAIFTKKIDEYLRDQLIEINHQASQILNTEQSFKDEGYKELRALQVVSQLRKAMGNFKEMQYHLYDELKVKELKLKIGNYLDEMEVLIQNKDLTDEQRASAARHQLILKHALNNRDEELLQQADTLVSEYETSVVEFNKLFHKGSEEKRNEAENLLTAGFDYHELRSIRKEFEDYRLLLQLVDLSFETIDHADRTNLQKLAASHVLTALRKYLDSSTDEKKTKAYEKLMAMYNKLQQSLNIEELIAEIGNRFEQVALQMQEQFELIRGQSLIIEDAEKGLEKNEYSEEWQAIKKKYEEVLQEHDRVIANLNNVTNKLARYNEIIKAKAERVEKKIKNLELDKEEYKELDLIQALVGEYSQGNNDQFLMVKFNKLVQEFKFQLHEYKTNIWTRYGALPDKSNLAIEYQPEVTEKKDGEHVKMSELSTESYYLSNRNYRVYKYLRSKGSNAVFENVYYKGDLLELDSYQIETQLKKLPDLEFDNLYVIDGEMYIMSICDPSKFNFEFNRLSDDKKIELKLDEMGDIKEFNLKENNIYNFAGRKVQYLGPGDAGVFRFKFLDEPAFRYSINKNGTEMVLRIKQFKDLTEYHEPAEYSESQGVRISNLEIRKKYKIFNKTCEYLGTRNPNNGTGLIFMFGNNNRTRFEFNPPIDVQYLKDVKEIESESESTESKKVKIGNKEFEKGKTYLYQGVKVKFLEERYSTDRKTILGCLIGFLEDSNNHTKGHVLFFNVSNVMNLRETEAEQTIWGWPELIDYCWERLGQNEEQVKYNFEIDSSGMITAKRRFYIDTGNFPKNLRICEKVLAIVPTKSENDNIDLPNLEYVQNIYCQRIKSLSAGVLKTVDGDIEANSCEFLRLPSLQHLTGKIYITKACYDNPNSSIPSQFQEQIEFMNIDDNENKPVNDRKMIREIGGKQFKIGAVYLYQGVRVIFLGGRIRFLDNYGGFRKGEELSLNDYQIENLNEFVLQSGYVYNYNGEKVIYRGEEDQKMSKKTGKKYVFVQLTDEAEKKSVLEEELSIYVFEYNGKKYTSGTNYRMGRREVTFIALYETPKTFLVLDKKGKQFFYPLVKINDLKNLL